jgi:hypothetical protein
VDSNTTSDFNIPIIIGSSTNPWAGSLTIKNVKIEGVADQTGLTLHSDDNINLRNVIVEDSQAGADLVAGGDVKVEYSEFSNNEEHGANIDAGGLVVVDYSNFNSNGSHETEGYGLKVKSFGEANLYEVLANNNKAFGADVNAGGPVYIDLSVFSGNRYYYECTTTYGTGYGLKVFSNSDIWVEDIVANNNYFFGADLQGEDVSIKKGTFNNNGNKPGADYPVGYGLQVTSSGTVTIDSIKAKKNRLFGADINAVGDVKITTGFFNSNQGITYQYEWEYDGYGLNVVTDGNITIDGIKANNNYLYGAYLDGKNVEVTNSFFSKNRSYGEEESVAYGLQVVGTNKVTLTNVKANKNQVFGANIKTDGPVTVKNSFFNGNKSYVWVCGEKEYSGYGIQIVTTSNVAPGAVSLVGVEATGNYLYGAYIDGKDVAIDTANFSNNGSGWALDLTGYGLKVVSKFTVALANVTADNNQKFGADIKADDLVAIEQSSFSGHIAYYHDYFSGEILSRDGGYGLKVVTLASIALEDVAANGNYLYGTYLQGNGVTVEDSSFSSNGSGVMTEPPGNGNGYGLMVVASDEVEFVGVTANNNQLFGADIKAGDDVTVQKSFFSGNQSVTFSPCHDEVFFHGYGLTVNTDEDIFLNFVTANRNNLWGASLNGYDVTVYNSQFNNNISDSTLFIDDTGLIVDAKGDVDIWKVEAKENRLIGATITADGDVYIADSNFNYNQGFTCLLPWCPSDAIQYHGIGLQVTTPGLIEVTGTYATFNNLFGAELNGGVVTVANSFFSNNGMGNGLIINVFDDPTDATTPGNVTLTNVVAENNGENGVDVTWACNKVVTVNGGTFSNNILYGLRVLNATLNLDGTQIFANNGSGNIFTDTNICVVVNPT